MHNVIMGAAPGQTVDHVNRDGLDNRRSNLRFATYSQQQVNQDLRVDNTSGFRGVYIDKWGRWQAQIQVDNKNLHLGAYSDPVTAALAYDWAAREHFGEFAVLNLPGQTPDVRPEIEPTVIYASNSSGYRGVSWNKSHRAYSAIIRADGKNKYLGWFADPIEAARAYDTAAREVFGERARLNFPDKPRNVELPDSPAPTTTKEHVGPPKPKNDGAAREHGESAVLNLPGDTPEVKPEPYRTILYASNTSGYRGVSWNKHQRAWSAHIRSDGRLKHLGYYDDPIEAARVYDAAARELLGELAICNFPDETGE